MRVLVIGSGAREHALAWKLAQSEQVTDLFIAPGNPGTAQLGTNVDVPVEDIGRLVHVATTNQIDLTVVGPEAPLDAGIVDRFQEHGLSIAGPTAAAARIESSKTWAKEIMNAAGVPTARAERYSDFESAAEAVLDMPLPVVIKANGLAAGKGVVIAQSHQEAVDTLRAMMVERSLGDAADEVLLEEFLVGLEVSIIGITDGKTILPFLPSCDYKRAFDGDYGPNTGGMGSYCPVPSVDPELMIEITRTILQPTVDELRNRGIEYRGILYAGLILTPDGPRVMEFNCRSGDPETQVILPLLDSDLLELLAGAANGDLSNVAAPSWVDGVALTVVLASGGYPDSYRKGMTIHGLSELPEGVIAFHAGTGQDSDGTIVTAGGRVLSLTTTAPSFEEARQTVYDAVSTVKFADVQYRTDIAAREIMP
ncbi:MAG: phosphoribosylamine--glycine ligase [Sphaerobacteraceae bacterium]|nr:MAG: phosphoribosylamine--glycine ligase [Sphaerobacteraceae bacterium]